jgi:hypothetical protein
VKHFVVEGSWWLPDKPDRHLAGTLAFDEEGARLDLYEPLHEFVLPPDQVVSGVDLTWTVVPIVLGRSRDGREFTLIEAGGMNLKGPLFTGQESYQPVFVVEGCLSDHDRFSEVTCGFDAFNFWANIPPLPDHGTAWDLKINMQSEVLAKARIPAANVELRYGVEGVADGDRVELTRWSAFVVTPKTSYSAAEMIRLYVRPLQDLLIFSLGRPVRLSFVQLQPSRTVGNDSGPGDLYFEAVQATASQVDRQPDLRSPSAPTIITLRSSPLNLNTLLQRWFRLRDEHQDALVLLLSPYYSPFMYAGHRYANTFQSAEVLASVLISSQDLPRQAHRKRVKDVVEALAKANLPAEHVDWTKSVIQGRNDKPLREKVQEFTEQTGTVGNAVLSASPDFAQIVASARAGVSHGGARQPKSPLERYWYGEALGLVIRTRILMILLRAVRHPQGTVASRAAFRHCLSQLRAIEANTV